MLTKIENNKKEIEEILNLVDERRNKVDCLTLIHTYKRFHIQFLLQFHQR
jgi:hypothetical protein